MDEMVLNRLSVVTGAPRYLGFGSELYQVPMYDRGKRG
jgi:hypothetical protein